MKLSDEKTTTKKGEKEHEFNIIRINFNFRHNATYSP